MKITKHPTRHNAYRIEHILPIHGIADDWAMEHRGDYTALWNEWHAGLEHEIDYTQPCVRAPANLFQAAAWIVADARESEGLMEKAAIVAA